MKQNFSVLIFLMILFSCSGGSKTEASFPLQPTPSGLSGEVLAKSHCGSCHAYVEPSALPKFSWEQDVLPSMGHRMGIFKGDRQPDSLFTPGLGGEIVRQANIYPEQPMLAKEDWDKLVGFYLQEAPDSLPTYKRSQQIKLGLKHFKVREIGQAHRPALTTMVKILPDSRGLVFADGKRNRSMLTFLNSKLELDYELAFSRAPVDFYEKKDALMLAIAGDGVFPSDLPIGSIQKVTKNGIEKSYNQSREIISNMQRPVQISYGDLDGDGLEDLVASEFGDLTGNLAWYQNLGKDRYTKHVLRPKPGAIKTILRDVNQDGQLDILSLMAQGDEGVFLYTNQGQGKFAEKQLLAFSPLQGSLHMELADFNQDGFEDLIYVSGDNADRTPFLKNFHGIYIFLNDGNYQFTQAWFFPLHGAYKAIPRDYDGDGDLDIAVISHFPDYVHAPEESFVYLENIGNLTFEAYTFPQSFRGRWFVMEAGDLDGDGDIDLALGSFVLFEPMGDQTGLGKRWMEQGPSVVVLENTIR